MSFILSADIGGSKIIVGVVSRETGDVLCAETFPLAAPYGVDAVRDILIAAVPSFAKRYPCSAVSASIPGLCDPAAGQWIYAPFSGIADFPVGSLLASLTGLPVYIENDVNACAVGERIFGICQDIGDFLWITVSNGIGGSLFCNGRLYTGAFGNAGEIGHMHVVSPGARCGCGACGCLEAEAAGPAIARRYRERTGHDCSAKTIAEAAKNGDADAAAVYAETGELLGRAVSAAVNLLNPAAVVFGGGVSMDFPLLEPGLHAACARELFAAGNPSLRLMQTGLGYHASLRGAAALALYGTRAAV